MKKRYIVLIIILMLPILTYSIIHIGNNITAKKVANLVANVDLPNDTQVVEKFHIAGKLTGNGNGMQYLGAVIIKSDLSIDKLKEYYAENNLFVEYQTSQKIDIIEHGDYALKTKINANNFYIVYAWGDSNTFFEDFDIRGY